MSEEDQDGKLAARMARMKPAEAPKRRRGDLDRSFFSSQKYW